MKEGMKRVFSVVGYMIIVAAKLQKIIDIKELLPFFIIK